MVEKAKITRDMLIGDIIRDHPDAERIIEKYLQGGCLTCPGVSLESLEFGASMHGVDPEQIVKELNDAQ